jgi:hypothetical protein
MYAHRLGTVKGFSGKNDPFTQGIYLHTIRPMNEATVSATTIAFSPSHQPQFHYALQGILSECGVNERDTHSINNSGREITERGLWKASKAQTVTN